MHMNRWIKWQPLSILTSEVSSKAFGVLFVGGILSFLMVNVCLNLYVDPYFAFRKSPFDERLPQMRVQQRFAKTLQVITRQPKVVLIGSSRVYRGFDVEDDFYNMGISSMTLVEASSYVKHVLNFTSAQKIVLGLDFWMIDEVTPTQAGWDKGTGTLPYTLKSFSRALLRGNEAFEIFKQFIHNNYATFFHTLKSFLRALLRGNEAFVIFKEFIRDNRVPSREEKWTYTGFFHTGKLSKKDVDNGLRGYEKNMQKVQVQLKMLSYLEDIIQLCKAKDVKLYVYISPLHPAIQEVYKKSKNSPYFNPWKESVASICKKADIPFHDLSDMLNDSPPLENGSTDIWIDYSHFSPKIGKKILQNLGVN